MVKRAQILLLAAEGQSSRQIAESAGVALNTVKLWRSRYLDDGGALNQRDRARTGRPRAVDRLSVIATMLTPPPAEMKHRGWSARGLARACGVSTYTVGRVWREYAVGPAQRGRLIVVAEPEFQGGWLTVVGSYLDPPDSAVALSLADDRDTGDLQAWCAVRGPDRGRRRGRGGERSEAFVAFCELVDGAHPVGIVR
ncbi:MAG: helix-turn-helix domain-containing protein, partial [Bifidobacteriaceae bacterium]|nr:helix-turn-helix domain-containing protein [Bifidobacteriaceae bacterium]